MKKIFLIFVLCLFFVVPAFGADWFIDLTLGTGANDGTSTDDAWQTLRDGFEGTSRNPGDRVWIRRVSVFDNDIEGESSNIIIADDGDVDAPLYFIGWPRAEKTINCDWVNGSTTVDNVDSNDLDFEKHVGRGITGPDGYRYTITAITDANTFVIDREYVGDSASNEDVVIEEDIDYDIAQAIDDSAWTIKLSTWTSDADDLPVIDYGSTAYRVYNNQGFNTAFRNIEWMDGTQNQVGAFQSVINVTTEMRNCIFSQSKAVAIGYFSYENVYLYNCIWKGSPGAGGLNGGPQFLSAKVYMKDCAIYGMAHRGISISASSDICFDNVNIGVEAVNGDSEFHFQRVCGEIEGHDVKLGGTNGLMSTLSTAFGFNVSFENYNKILNQHRMFFTNMIVDTRVDVTTVTPNKKYSDYVIEASYLGEDVWSYERDLTDVLYTYIVPQSISKTYRIYIYNDTGQTLNSVDINGINLRCRYVDEYDDDTEYHYSDWTYSDEVNIAAAADADDWDYVEVGPFTPAESTAYVECQVCSSRQGNLDAGDIYIDPSVQHP